MKRTLWFSLVVDIAGVWLCIVGLQRLRLPYNEADRYFDAEVGTVFRRQVAEVYTLAGGSMVVAALLVAAVSFGPARKDQPSR